MKFKPVPMLIVAAAIAAGYMVWKRQKAANTTTEGDTPAAAQGFGAIFESLFGGPGAATAPATSPASETATAADNGT